jgi:hypothetical protein
VASTTAPPSKSSKWPRTLAKTLAVPAARLGEVGTVQYARSPSTSCLAWSTSTPWSASTGLAPETGSSLAALQIGAVTEREITRALIALNAQAWPSRR